MKEKVAEPKKVSHSQKTSDRGKEMNIGHLSKSQLKKKLEFLTKSKNFKRNRNGKLGINKANDYKHLPDAPRKKCHKCGNQNHLAVDCKLRSPKAQSPKASDLKDSKPLKVLVKPDKPCYQCGSKLHSIYVCEEYHALYYDYYQPKRNIPYMNRKMSKLESNSDPDQGRSKFAPSNAKISGKKGSNLCWVLKDFY